MLAELRRLATAARLERCVTFVGHVDSRVRSLAYQSAALVAIPSRQEAMSIVVLEAGITGTPVLISDACGFDDVAAVDGGRVVPATVDGLAMALEEITLDRARLIEMGTNLRRRVEASYCWDSIVDRYLVLFSGLSVRQPA